MLLIELHEQAGKNFIIATCQAFFLLTESYIKTGHPTKKTKKNPTKYNKGK